MADPVNKVVQEHTYQLAVLTGSMSEIKDAIKKIADTQAKIEVLIERQTNHEENTLQSFRHVHERISANEQEIKAIKNEHQVKCDLVTPSAKKGESAYNALLWTAKTLGGVVVTAIVAIFFWAIEKGALK